MKRPVKIVEVTWLDAHTVDRGGWADVSEFEAWKNGAVCVSIGYLVKKDAAHVALAASLTFDKDESEIEQVSGTMIIPRGMIRKIRVLK